MTQPGRRGAGAALVLAVFLLPAALAVVPVHAGATLVSLEKTYEPFAERFNNDKGVVRFAAILSPTCTHCLHGARAISSQIVEHYGDVDDLAVYVVWAPMLADDNEEAARDASWMFDKDPRVTQYWDPERYMGYLYRFDVFPDAWSKMAASMSVSHPFHDAIAERAATGADRPEWDIYMYFRAGQEWERDAVPPARFIRHFAHWRENGATLSLMWIDDYAKKPITGSLPDMMSSIMHELIPHH